MTKEPKRPERLVVSKGRSLSATVSRGDPRRHLNHLLIGLRLLTVSAAFLAGTVFYAPDEAFYCVIAFFYAVTFVHLFLLRWKSKEVLISQVQLAVDVVLTTCLVHYTGGIDSPFVLIYPIMIVAAAATGSGAAFSQTIAATSALFFGILVVSEASGLLDSFAGQYSSYDRGPWLVAFLYFFRIFIFALVSVVGNVLVSRLLYEQSRSQSVEDFRERLLGRMNHGAITADKDDKILYANEHALQILRCSYSDILGKDWRGLFRSSRIYPSSKESAIISARIENEMRISVPLVDGTEKVVGLTFSHQQMQDGQLVHKVILFRDLTAILRMEKKLQAAEKWALLGELAAGITHEIRNPLSSIQGSIEVLKTRKTFEGDDIALLDLILEESEHLNDFLDNYLSFAQKKGAEQMSQDLGEVVNQLLKMVKGHPRLRDDVALHWEQGSDVTTVVIDDQQIRQVLLNVIQNALDAMPHGGDLTVRLGLCGSDVQDSGRDNVRPLGEWVRLDIEDTGVGMAPEVLDRLYEPFFSTKKDGHGIGLAMCRRIVEAHHGFFRVQSEPGKGTTFSTYLPAAEHILRAQEGGK